MRGGGEKWKRSLGGNNSEVAVVRVCVKVASASTGLT